LLKHLLRRFTRKRYGVLLAGGNSKGLSARKAVRYIKIVGIEKSKRKFPVRSLYETDLAFCTNALDAITGTPRGPAPRCGLDSRRFRYDPGATYRNGTSSPIGICGRYSVSFSGILVNGQGYFAGVGEYNTDCYGNLSGVETENFNGKVCQYTATGTYKLRRNGTGTVSVTIVPVAPAGDCENATHTEAIAVGSKGRIVKAIGIGSTAVTINEEWVRQ
jgi:hypothetical protein